MIQEYGQGQFRLEAVHGNATEALGEVAIGQPWQCVLSVVHDPSDALPESLAPPFPPGEDWVVLEGPVVRGAALPGGGWRSTATWQYMALQPGEHSTGDYTLTMLRGAKVQPVAATLTVQTELAAEEAAPRPMAEALPVPPDAAGSGGWFLLGALVLALLGWAWLRFRRRERPQEGITAISAGERLQQASWSEEDGRESLFAWHRDLRLAVDEVAAQRGAMPVGQRATWTDAEWKAAGPSPAPMSADLWQRWCDLLDELERMKYAAHLPSRLTAEELQLRVRQAAGDWAQELASVPHTPPQGRQGVPA